MSEQEKIYQKKGQLAVLKEKRQELRIGIDVIAKGVVVLFDPMDNDCTYTDKIDELKLDIYTKDLLKKKRSLNAYNKQIEDIEDYLNKIGEVIE
jgi:hypothetical protein